MEFSYAIAQPYTDKTDRLETALIVSTHRSAVDAFTVLDKMHERLRGFGLPEDTIELLVVDRNRRPVVRSN